MLYPYFGAYYLLWVYQLHALYKMLYPKWRNKTVNQSRTGFPVSRNWSATGGQLYRFTILLFSSGWLHYLVAAGLFLVASQSQAGRRAYGMWQFLRFNSWELQ